ncbi:MAG TPA: ribosome maturation factor RimM [Bacillota bacterium]|nr:ribosome maturation factor RimM [Bacillota bacterium]
MKNYLVIGKIAGVHGVRGEVKIAPLTDDVRRFSSLKECFIMDDKEKVLSTMKVTHAHVDSTRVLLHFEGLDDRDEAAKWNGRFLAVSRENAVKLPEDRYFITDLQGLKVIDDEHGELGVISDIIPSGSGDIIVVKRKDRLDLLIPFLKTIVTRISLDEGVMLVTLPAGLYDVYES